MPHSSLATGLESMSTDVPLPFCHVTDFLTFFSLSSDTLRKFSWGKNDVQSKKRQHSLYNEFLSSAKKPPRDVYCLPLAKLRPELNQQQQLHIKQGFVSAPRPDPGGEAKAKDSHRPCLAGAPVPNSANIPIRRRYNRVSSRSRHLKEHLEFVILHREYFLKINSLSNTLFFPPFGTLLSYQSLQGGVFALLLEFFFKVKSKLGLTVGLKQNPKEEKGSSPLCWRSFEGVDPCTN